MNKLVIATGNAGKLRELQSLLAPLAIEVISQKSLDIPDADETGLSFVENALIKARHAAAISGLPALADDSGLCVDVLHGAPGIYSARYAGVGANDADNNHLLLQNLLPFRADGLPLTARFVCVLVMVRHAEDPLPLICQGIWEGEILSAPRGADGFGYDPLFWVPELHASSAELAPGVKNRASHRGKAMNALLRELQSTLPTG
ncbi:XTP/dITP diphosphohydrolase [Fluviicoccus keumensis]|uniref:dITP/XTP pyrophosphatase n=1 Tax=Fluviicoccus keumensis TaxID=1435465 RepID=A0A4Q7YL25_9GAMM|nr:RdgB/HAM1 family non-canonical purine NTP pyrophosphatase [Fluviicoccus keumensis]RZU38392.1 XTP/dITP diphosphohydrolase [Fluviicoccus keumensis]